MSDSLPALLERIKSFRFDPPECDLTFADRLARENGWSIQYANEVIAEYLRFCILAVHCNHPVTPSVDVDQAWHLHLTYSRSYWDHFCKTVLQQPLHHDPTTGGPTEGRKFRDWYARTLHSYYQVFQQHPPTEIWPSPEARFAEVTELRWVNTHRFWLIRKPVLNTAWLVVLPLAALPVWKSLRHTLLLWLPHGLPTGMTTALLALQTLACCSMLLLLLVSNRWRKTTEAPELPQSGGPTAEELAVLAGGRQRLLWLAIVRLRALGLIDAEKRGLFHLWKLVAHPTRTVKLPPLETTVLNGIRHHLSVASLTRSVQPHHDPIHRHLQYYGLLNNRLRTSPGMLAVQLSIPLFIYFNGLSFFVRSLYFPHITLLTFTTVVVCLIASLQTQRVTSLGRNVLLCKRGESLPETTGETQQTTACMPPLPQLSIAAAVHGFSAVAGLQEFKHVLPLVQKSLPLNQPSTADSSAACGGGCGTAGGCSGCGGCGG